MYARMSITWLLLSVIAILNGVLRNSFLTPRYGEQIGHILSTVILCLLIFIVARASIRWIGPKNGIEVRTIGILWFLMTIAFEFLAGHYLFKHPWSRLLADYNMARGRVWILVLVSLYFAPLWAARTKKLY